MTSGRVLCSLFRNKIKTNIVDILEIEGDMPAYSIKTYLTKSPKYHVHKQIGMSSGRVAFLLRELMREGKVRKREMKEIHYGIYRHGVVAIYTARGCANAQGSI